MNATPFLLRLLGAPSLEGPTGLVSGRAVQRHRLALLALLVNAPRNSLSRDRVLGLLWPEAEMFNARQLLNAALYSLRRVLGERALVSEGDALRLDCSGLRIDVLEFETACQNSDPAQAVALYTGPFLEGLALPDAVEFEHWQEAERDRLQRLYHRALAQMAELTARDHGTASAAPWWRRLLSCTPTDALVVERLMEALASAGDRAAALQVAASHTQLMQQDFGAAPDARVERLAHQLRSTMPVAPETLLAGTATNGTAGFTEDALSAALAPDLELIRPLGEGSVARVFVAREPALARLVAVKILDAELATDQRKRLRFEREAQAAAGLSHRNVIVIHRIGNLANGVPYIVMEHIEGRTMSDVLAARGPLSVSEARRVLAQVTAALALAHRKGVVHRDVRPGNIMEETETGRIVLMDFGLAALLENALRVSQRLTGPDERLGIPNYMSPEQVRGDVATQQSDIYSLGILGYELLTGRVPFGRGTKADVMRAQLVQQPQPLQQLRPDVDATLADLIRRCMAKNPDQRPRAGEVCAALAHDA